MGVGDILKPNHSNILLCQQIPNHPLNQILIGINKKARGVKIKIFNFYFPEMNLYNDAVWLKARDFEKSKNVIIILDKILEL